MDKKESKDWFDGVDTVICEPLKFKTMLAIGEDAYASLRLKKNVFEAWSTFIGGLAGAFTAASPFVASTFFASSSLWSILSLGVAATPLGWIVAASVAMGGAGFGFARSMRSENNERVTVIPEFINTPLDILGLALFNYIVPLALKVADADGDIDNSEKQVISNYFIEQHGYDPTFVEKGIGYIKDNLAEFSTEELAKNLAEFKKGNPDCNYTEMSQDTLKLLIEIMEADGKIDEKEENLIKLVEEIFSEVGQSNIRKKVKAGIDKIKNGSANIYKNTSTLLSESKIKNVMQERLQAATSAELDRMSEHLGLKDGTGWKEIETAYLDAADNSIFNVIRGLVPSDAPTYSKALRLLFKDMQPLSKTLDENWKRVKSLELWNHQSDLEKMSDNELEDQILTIYKAKYNDVERKMADPGFLKKMASFVPGVSSGVVGTVAAVSTQTAVRLPFASVAPGVLAGPIGIGLGVILIGSKLSGPAYRKIQPATVELILIGQRINNMPKE